MIGTRAVSGSLRVVALGLVLAAGTAWADDLKDGRAALAKGQLDEAQRLFEKAASSGYAEGRAGVGQVHLKRLNLGEAMAQFQAAQKMDPTLALPYYGQAEVLRRQGKCEQALPLLEKAVDLDRKFPEAALALGNCYTQTKQMDRAVQALTPGLKWGPKWRPRFLVAIGDAEMARDSLRSASIYYTRAREESPEDPVAHQALAEFYMKRGTFELAVPEYQAAVELDSSDVEMRFGLGRALFYARRYDEALQVYRDVVQRAPDFAAGQFALGDLLYRAGAADRKRYEEARAPLEKYTQMNPEDGKGWGTLGKVLFFTGQKDEALAAMNKAEQLKDDNKEMYTLRARIKVEKKDWDGALQDYGRGDPGPEDQLRLAQVFVFQGRTQSADSLYHELLSKDSTAWAGKFALLEIGKLRYRAKDYPAAIQVFQRRIALDPNSDEAYYYLGLSEKELKRYPESIAALNQAAQLAPSKSDRWFWLGLVYADVDSVPQARAALSRAVELDSAGTNKNTGLALRQLGYYDLTGNNLNSAVPLLERSVTISPQDSQAWLWLAQAYHNSAKREKACEAYERVLALDPDSDVAIKGITALGCK